MDRHIQQTNDRLQCIKQVGVWRGPLPQPGRWWGQGSGLCYSWAPGAWVEVLMGTSLLPRVP